jgi:hypothetical protein
MTFRPVLWYVRVTRRRDLGKVYLNATLGSRHDKSAHDWQQGDGSVIMPLIANLTRQGELIVDPSEGSGLWGDTAAKMGRRFIGCDIVKGGSTRVVRPG